MSDTGRIERSEGRRLFGLDPAAYDAARPGHAARVYEILVERCALQAGTSVLEVGPGTGQATKRLLLLGADPLVALEPNAALAAYLGDSLGGRVDISVVALEDAELLDGRFDLAVAASSFTGSRRSSGSRSCSTRDDLEGGSRCGGRSSEKETDRTRSSPRPVRCSRASDRVPATLKVAPHMPSTPKPGSARSPRPASRMRTTRSCVGRRAGTHRESARCTARSRRSRDSTRRRRTRSWTASRAPPSAISEAA